MLLLLGAYFVIQTVIRVLVSDTANLDEAEQLVLTQDIELGYGSQPPLYTWLQALVFSVLGTNIAALAFLKNSLLFGTYAFTYLSAKRISGSDLVAVAAALGLLFLPQIAWESQRDLTHSVLATTMASTTVFCLVRVIQLRKTIDYILFGVCTGLGVMSKYNYPVFLLALIAATLSLRPIRHALLNWRVFAERRHSPAGRGRPSRLGNSSPGCRPGRGGQAARPGG